MSDCENDVLILKDAGAPTWSLFDFDIGKKLGEGQFGSVYLARERRSGFICALKAIKKSQLLATYSHHLLRREIEIHSHLLHPNILQFYGWFTTYRNIWLVLEVCPSGELMEKIIEGGLQDEAKVSRCIRQMIDAIHACHRLNILHRDIKPENILIDADGNLKLADFGWAAHVPNLEEQAPGSQVDNRVYMKRRRKTYCGTLDYLSPEICRKEWYGREVDLWCLGVLCFEIKTGGPPFSVEPYLAVGLSEKDARKKQQEEIQQCDIRNKVAYRTDMTPELKDWLSHTLSKDPANRLNTAEMMAHPFIRKHNVDVTDEMLENMNRKDYDDHLNPGSKAMQHGI